MSALSRYSLAVKSLEPHADHLAVVGPASRANVDKSERLVGLLFPPSYRAFLYQFGAGSILGREIYGVVPDPEASGTPNVVWQTLDARRTFGLPPEYLKLVDLDDSSAIALDASASTHDAEMPVVWIWPGELGADLLGGELAPDFGSFFARFVNERLDALYSRRGTGRRPGP